MTTYAYRNVIANYTKTYSGIEVGPAGVSYSYDNITLNAFVPTYLERFVDGVLSVSNIIRPDTTPITNQEIAEQKVRLIASGSSYEFTNGSTPIGIVGVAATFVTLTPADSVATPGLLQLSSAGIHSLTTGATHAGKNLYVTWTGGTGVSGLYPISTVDDTLIITLDTPSEGFAGMGTAVVSVVATPIALYTHTILADTLAADSDISIESLWSHTSSANNKTIGLTFGGETFGAYVTPTTVASTVLNKTITNTSTATQVSSATTSNGLGSIAGAIVAGTVDTTADADLVITGTLATANEVLQLEIFSCKIAK